MSKMNKKLPALFLALVLVLGMTPAAARPRMARPAVRTTL